MSFELYRVSAALDTIRQTTGNRELSLQTLQVFLFVAQRHPTNVGQVEIEKMLQMTQTSTSRNINYLGKGVLRHYPGRSRKGEKEPPASVVGGYGLLEVEQDEFYRKRNLVSLTPRGVVLANTIASIIAGTTGGASDGTKTTR
jgi:DNA-binding MarR family transcriptional regulator